MHPSTHLRAELDELRAELAELKAKLAPTAPAATVDPRLVGMPDGSHIDATGLLRDGSGQIIPSPLAAKTPEEAMAKAKVEREAKEAAEVARQTKGLPDGYWRDPCGLVRMRSTGAIAAAVDLEDAELAAVERIRGAEHRAWKVSQGLPVRPLPEDTEGEG